MEIISPCFERVTPFRFSGLPQHVEKNGWRQSYHCACCFSCLFTNKMSLCQIVSMECLSPLFSSPVCSCSLCRIVSMECLSPLFSSPVCSCSLCQIVSMECLSPLFSSPVCSCSHDLANAMMSTKKACATKSVKFQQVNLNSFQNYAHPVSKWIKLTKKWKNCIPSLNRTGATIFLIIFHWKPEMFLAVVVAPTLGCAGSEQVKHNCRWVWSPDGLVTITCKALQELQDLSRVNFCRLYKSPLA